MDKLKEYFTTKKEVADYFAGDKIQCLICGKWFCCLAKHLVYKHNTTAEEYKETYNLPWGRGLVSDKTFGRQAAALKKRYEEGEESLLKTPEEKRAIMQRAIDAKKREKKSYDRDRIIKDGRVYNRNKLISSTDRAVWIIERMEEEKATLHSINLRYGNAGYHLLLSAFYLKPELKDRYEKATKNAEKMTRNYVTGKLSKKKEEIKNSVLSLREKGMTTIEIAEEVHIGKTTVKRILRKEGTWAES